MKYNNLCFDFFLWYDLSESFHFPGNTLKIAWLLKIRDKHSCGNIPAIFTSAKPLYLLFLLYFIQFHPYPVIYLVNDQLFVSDNIQL